VEKVHRFALPWRVSPLSPPPPQNPLALLMPNGVSVGIPGSSPRIRVLQGGLPAAQVFFAQLTAGLVPVFVAGYPGQLVKLPTGGDVGLRQVSKSGPPTIDVNVPGVPFIKIKFL
jgi:hypothetical protein